MEHRVSYKVYYEDTDCLGMVYHANYLRYFERGRTEYIEQLGYNPWDWNKAGYYVVVYTMNIAFRKPAVLGDRLDVVSTFHLTSPFRGQFDQRIERNDETLVTAKVEVVCVDKNHKLQRFPSSWEI